MKLIRGDILTDIRTDQLTIILHGCNCHHVMGAGIAKYLKTKYPKIYEVDRETSRGDITKLGSYSLAKVANKLIILNCYTQFGYDSRRKQVNYEAVYKCLDEVRQVVDRVSNVRPDLTIELRSPQIGCGLAGGEWLIVEQMFEHLLPDANVYYI